MDQLEEKEENRFQESTDRRKEEVQNNSEESADQRKEEEEEEESSEAATLTAVAPLFAHPCSRLLQYLARVCACCLGLRDSFCNPKPSPVPDEPAANPSQEGEEGDKDKMTNTYFYMQEVTTRVLATRMRPQKPGNPREGNGGTGGHHH